MVAEKLGPKVQPIVIKDLASFYNEGTKHARRGKVHIEILPPVEFKEGWLEESRTDMIAAKKVI
jgi:1-acyl-sn-glycerol-3-phosphate acyltransferase